MLSSRDRLAIAFGGVIGAVCRWAISAVTDSSPNDGGWFTYAPNTSVSRPPYELAAGRWGTLAANLIGCLLLGAIATLLVRSSGSTRRWLLAAGTGFCGALTTFATFAVDAVLLLRTPQPSVTDNGLQAITYIVLSLVSGAVAFWVGRRTANAFGAP